MNVLRQQRRLFFLFLFPRRGTGWLVDDFVFRVSRQQTDWQTELRVRVHARAAVALSAACIHHIATQHQVAMV